MRQGKWFMKINFISVIRRGNGRGTGFFYIPKDKICLFRLNDWVRIKLSEEVSFFSKIIFYSHRLEIYIPQHIVSKNDLLGKEVKIEVKKLNGFYASVGFDGRVYIPQDIVQKQIIKQNDIILIKAIKENKVIKEKYSKIHVTIRRQRKQKEYTCIFDRNFYGEELLFQIEKGQQRSRTVKLSAPIERLLRRMHDTFIQENSAIIFKGNKVPAIIHTNLNYSNIAFYLGAYFADGTKKGNNWAICASTFEQARYYLEMHNSIIKDSKPELILSYTDIENSDKDKLKRKLAKVWKDRVGLNVYKFRIRKSIGKFTFKRNQYGTLVIRESRQLLLNIYNILLEFLIKEILTNKNKKLAIDFICGVLEGDGCVPSKKRGHITISLNKKDVPIIENVFKVAQIKFKILKEGENKYTLRVGSLTLIKNFHLLKDKIFILYPKRRKAFLERFKTVGAVQSLIKNYKPVDWVRIWLNNNDFIAEKGKITSKGLRFARDFKACKIAIN